MMQLLDCMLPKPEHAAGVTTAAAGSTVSGDRRDEAADAESVRRVADTRNVQGKQGREQGAERGPSFRQLGAAMKLQRRAKDRQQLVAEESSESPASPPTSPVCPALDADFLMQPGKFMSDI